MARNQERRQHLADAGLAVLAESGARGLTHRAVDAAAGVPVGTTSNYFHSRTELIKGLVDRIGERLAPDPATLDRLAGRHPDRKLFATYIKDVARRLTRERHVTLALFELRLEGARRPEVAEVLGDWLRRGFRGDVAFNRQAGLPGGKREIALFHYAIDGLLFDRLTLSIDPRTSVDRVVDDLVEHLLPE